LTSLDVRHEGQLDHRHARFSAPMVDGRWSMVDGRWSMVDGTQYRDRLVSSLPSLGGDPGCLRPESPEHSTWKFKTKLLNDQRESKRN